MKVLNGFSRKGQRVEHDLLSGQPQVLWPVAVHFMGGALAKAVPICSGLEQEPIQQSCRIFPTCSGCKKYHKQVS
jgi:hypothetical protein